jgi:hypothetical protein
MLGGEIAGLRGRVEATGAEFVDPAGDGLNDVLQSHVVIGVSPSYAKAQLERG